MKTKHSRRRRRPLKKQWAANHGKFKSGLEARVSETLGSGWTYEGSRFKYTVDHTYNPDFVKGDVVIEAKGFLRSGDAMKYKAIAKMLAKLGKRYVFVWSSPHKPVRKGTRLTNAQWCEKNNIEWLHISELWRLR